MTKQKIKALDVNELTSEWQKFLDDKNWEELIKNADPKQSGCGIIYELGNPLNRKDEDFAIADMRQLPFTEPHYHLDNDYEIFFVLQGKALYVVGYKELPVQTG